jgi:DNA helicase-2/ATP-dependent DNA helicase PcrA
MTARINQPDTEADRQVRECLAQEPPRSFVMVSGAGSGKTTSLVKALAHMSQTRGAQLRRHGQKIACITYTEVAAGEIWDEVGNSPIFHVSTIHSFLWTIFHPFQPEIREWVRRRIDEKIAEAEEKRAKPRTQERTRITLASDIARYREQIASLANVRGFKYGTGSDYSAGLLGHDDVLKIGPYLIEAHELLHKLVAGRFPVVFVDESQDTFPTFVTALRRIQQTTGSAFSLGFFGDPMQKIYMSGVGPIPPLETDRHITKRENFRCPRPVLEVINRIRAEDDGIEQVGGRMVHAKEGGNPTEGTARLFIMPTDDHDRRTTRLTKIRNWLASANSDPLWREDRHSAVRMMVLVHRMAATRLGFPNLYAALNDRAPPSLKSGLVDGTAWVLRPFLSTICPLVLAARANDNFAVIRALRLTCPLLSSKAPEAGNMAVILDRLNEGVQTLKAMFENGYRSSIKSVLEMVFRAQLLTLDERFDTYLEDAGDTPDAEDEERAAVEAFLACHPAELLGYRDYIEGNSPFTTQHGVKGAEFDRVLVVLDDEESAYNLYSYGKYFGYTPLSGTDRENVANGDDSVVDRTRRLFYVCCSRATKDLAVVLFASDIAEARAAVLRKGFFPEDEIYDAEAINV